MKARDLAALAALGIAGKMAYDKFGRKKDDEPKSKGKLGEAQSANDGDAGESEARMSKRDMNEGSGRRDAGGNTEKLSRQERDILEKLSRQERDVPDRIMGRDAAGSRFTDKAAAPVAVAKPVRKQEVEARSLDSTGGPSRYNRAADSNAAGATFSSSAEGMKANVPRRTPGAADGVGSTFSSTEAGMAANVPRRTVPDYSNEGRNARAPVNATFSSTEAGMAANVPRRTPGAADGVGPTFSSTEEGMAANVPRRPGQAPVASSTAAGMTRYVPRNLEAVEQARLDALRSSGGRRAKGGVVKMASGGMASSKMSKPSGASRGDGIAQRGRTRGTLR